MIHNLKSKSKSSIHNPLQVKRTSCPLSTRTHTHTHLAHMQTNSSSWIQNIKLWHNQNNSPPQLWYQLPNIAVCLVCTIVPLLWLSGRFASLANSSGTMLLLTCHWFAYREMQEIRDWKESSTWKANRGNARQHVQVLIQPFVKVERISEWVEI